MVPPVSVVPERTGCGTEELRGLDLANESGWHEVYVGWGGGGTYRRGSFRPLGGFGHILFGLDIATLLLYHNS